MIESVMCPANDLSIRKCTPQNLYCAVHSSLLSLVISCSNETGMTPSCGILIYFFTWKSSKCLGFWTCHVARAKHPIAAQMEMVFKTFCETAILAAKAEQHSKMTLGFRPSPFLHRRARKSLLARNKRENKITDWTRYPSVLFSP